MGAEQAEYLIGHGVRPEDIIIGHMDLSQDVEVILDVLKRGVNVGFDTVGKLNYCPDSFRAQALKRIDQELSLIHIASQVLYQKKGVTISKLALNLLSKDVGDRIAPISYYQEEFQVSRGTMQNAFNYLKDIGAVTLAHHGHQGTYIEALDYVKLQENCLQQEIMGIMPLPYPQTYEGFATAIYEQLKTVSYTHL